MSRVSVIIPVFNHAPFVRAAVESMLRQTWTDLKIVVVDDGSTDGSVAEIAELRGGNLTILCGPHRGPAGARNQAIAACDSEYVAFMDADDISDPDRISKQLRAMETSSVDLVATELRFIDEDGNPLPGRWSRPAHAYRDPFGALLERNWIGTPSVMVRRHVFDDAGLFDASFTHAEDYDMWLRIGRTHPIGYVNSAVIQCRRHRHNMSRNLAAHQRFEQLALQKIPHDEVQAAFRRLYAGQAERDEAWIWFLLRSGHSTVAQELVRAIQRNPYSRSLQFAHGVHLTDHGRFAEAAEVFAALQVTDPAAINNAVVTALASGQTIDATGQLLTALHLRPSYQDARDNIRALASGLPLRLTRRPLRDNLVPLC